jgi:hypothetical protein
MKQRSRLQNRMIDEELNALVVDVMLNQDKYKLNEYPFEEVDLKYADLNAYLKIVSVYFNIRYEAIIIIGQNKNGGIYLQEENGYI